MAKTELEAAVRLNTAFRAAHLNLGMALVQLGQLDEAEVADRGNAAAGSHQCRSGGLSC
jgi:hypothetical protein